MMKEELAEIVRTFEAVGPLVGNAVKSGQLFSPQAGERPVFSNVGPFWERSCR